mmetsp:Transcript_78969/g.176630  ORF Transcript_78969/g.176630 Transcript_78969/m.176630 type:complete len:208 (+) Transcript_78969:161-784(+)
MHRPTVRRLFCEKAFLRGVIPEPEQTGARVHVGVPVLLQRSLDGSIHTGLPRLVRRVLGVRPDHHHNIDGKPASLLRGQVLTLVISGVVRMGELDAISSTHSEAVFGITLSTRMSRPRLCGHHNAPSRCALLRLAVCSCVIVVSRCNAVCEMNSQPCTRGRRSRATHAASVRCPTGSTSRHEDRSIAIELGALLRRCSSASRSRPTC